MDILIPLETAHRELHYKIYLCNKLALHGFKCYLGDKSSIQQLIKNFQSFIYLDKGYHKGTSEKFYQKIKKNGGLIINLDEEGAVDFPDNQTLKSRYDKDLFSYVDKVFMWGKSQSQLIRNRGVKGDKIVVTGHPRFELLNSKFHFLYEHEVKEIKSRYSKYILVNTNMGFGNNIRGDNFVIHNYISRFPNIKKLIKQDKLKRDKIIDFLNLFSKKSNVPVVLRPHPEENSDYYKKNLNSIENISVEYQYSTIPWIIGCDFLIHPDCTTGIESLIIGKKSLSLLPHELESKLITYLPVNLSLKFNDSDYLIEFMSDSKNKSQTISDEDSKQLDDYFSLSKNITEKIISEIINLSNNQALLPKNNLGYNILLKLYLSGFKQYISGREKLIKNKLKGFDTLSVKNIQALLSKNESAFSSNIVSKISRNLFLVKNSKN